MAELLICNKIILFYILSLVEILKGLNKIYLLKPLSSNGYKNLAEVFFVEVDVPMLRIPEIRDPT